LALITAIAATLTVMHYQVTDHGNTLWHAVYDSNKQTVASFIQSLCPWHTARNQRRKSAPKTGADFWTMCHGIHTSATSYHDM